MAAAKLTRKKSKYHINLQIFYDHESIVYENLH